MTDAIIVEEYNENWKNWFHVLTTILKDKLKNGSYIDILHLGSTSVPNLAAKPKIDIYIVINEVQLTNLISKLQNLGYQHVGDLGITNREAFKLTNELLIYQELEEIPPHNLYSLIQHSDEYYRMTLFQRYLCEFPEKAEKYGILKKKIAPKYDYDQIDSYVDEKGVLIKQYIEEAIEYFNYSKLIGKNEENNAR